MSVDICQHFSQYFSLVIAKDRSLLQEVYKIRYQVYCEELNYEPTEKFPDGMERDAYDSHSIHCLLQHKPTGKYAGCVRVIVPQKGASVTKFPWQRFASNLIYPHSEHQWTNICEISRLAVRQDFRKRQGDREMPLGTVLPDLSGGKRRFPLIAMSLYWAAFCLALNLNLDVLGIVEPRLARHLRRCGLNYCLISQLFEFHGKRGIFFNKPPELIDSLEADTYEFFSLLNNIIVEGLLEEGHISSPYPLPLSKSATEFALLG